VVWVRGDGRVPRGRLSREEQEKVEVNLRLVPGGEDKAARGGHSHDGYCHWSVCLFLPPEGGGGDGRGG
jgi:hypothetical protein